MPPRKDSLALKSEKIGVNTGEPHWACAIGSGLSVQGVCSNQSCATKKFPKFGTRIFAHYQTGSTFHFRTDDPCCPECKTIFIPAKVFITNCDISIVVKEQGKKQESIGPWKCVPGEFQTLELVPENLEGFVVIDFVTTATATAKVETKEGREEEAVEVASTTKTESIAIVAEIQIEKGNAMSRLKQAMQQKKEKEAEEKKAKEEAANNARKIQQRESEISAVRKAIASATTEEQLVEVAEKIDSQKGEIKISLDKNMVQQAELQKSKTAIEEQHLQLQAQRKKNEVLANQKQSWVEKAQKRFTEVKSLFAVYFPGFRGSEGLRKIIEQNSGRDLSSPQSQATSEMEQGLKGVKETLAELQSCNAEVMAMQAQLLTLITAFEERGKELKNTEAHALELLKQLEKLEDAMVQRVEAL